MKVKVVKVSVTTAVGIEVVVGAVDPFHAKIRYTFVVESQYVPQSTDPHENVLLKKDI